MQKSLFAYDAAAAHLPCRSSHVCLYLTFWAEIAFTSFGLTLCFTLQIKDPLDEEIAALRAALEQAGADKLEAVKDRDTLRQQHQAQQVCFSIVLLPGRFASALSCFLLLLLLR